MVRNKLDIQIQKSDIDIAHRLGAFRQDENRPIICKFVSRETKTKVLRVRRNLKGSAMVIHEDLNIKNAKLLEDVLRKPEVISAWSDEGRIIAISHSGGNIKVKLHTNLDGLFTTQSQ